MSPPGPPGLRARCCPLDVAVDHLVLMGRLQSRGHLAGQMQHLRHRQCLPRARYLRASSPADTSARCTACRGLHPPGKWGRRDRSRPRPVPGLREEPLAASGFARNFGSITFSVHLAAELRIDAEEDHGPCRPADDADDAVRPSVPRSVDFCGGPSATPDASQFLSCPRSSTLCSSGIRVV